MSTLTGLRYGTTAWGRFVARDRIRGRCYHPEHAEWIDGRVRWYPHPIGGKMRPFSGPNEIYKRLCEGGLRMFGDGAGK